MLPFCIIRGLDCLKKMFLKCPYISFRVQNSEVQVERYCYFLEATGFTKEISILQVKTKTFPAIWLNLLYLLDSRFKFVQIEEPKVLKPVSWNLSTRFRVWGILVGIRCGNSLFCCLFCTFSVRLLCSWLINDTLCW